MSAFLILFLVVSLILVASEYDWKGVLFLTIVAGFLQDPIRKLAETDSSYFGMISFVSFIVTFILLKSRRAIWYLQYICWSNPKIISLLPVFFYLIILQSLNSFSRFNDLTLSIAGILFYLLPLTALWVGFNIGTDKRLLRTFLLAYVVACSICSVSILISLSGVESDLLKEVGLGLDITGLESEGHSGLWRTTEIAGWHLAAGACFSFILGITEEKSFKQYLFFFISIALTLLSTTTGRRKALGLVILFVSLYLLYYSFSVNGSRISRIFSSLGLVALLSFGAYEAFLGSQEQHVLDPYLDRSSSLTVEATQERFGGQGLGAFLRGLEIAGPFGFGVGAGVNAGSTGIGSSRAGIRSLGYVVEGGGGRIVAELGGIGIIILAYLLYNVGILYYRNFKIARNSLPVDEVLMLMGLLIFTIVNLITFFTASQLYNDFFVLIMIGVSSGTFLSIPVVASQYQSNLRGLAYE